MNASPLRLYTSAQFRSGLFALGFALLLSALALECRAVTSYAFSINTTSLSGQNATLAFDLTGGDAAAANNTAAIGSLATNGALSSLANFTLTDTGFFNEVQRNITFGTSLSFTVNLTENRTAPAFDQFSFFALDPTTLLPLLGTTDPTGADALFAIDINGQPGGVLSVFASVASGVTWQVTPTPTTTPPPVGVPDGGSAVFLMAISCVGTIVARAVHSRVRG